MLRSVIFTIALFFSALTVPSVAQDIEHPPICTASTQDQRSSTPVPVGTGVALELKRLQCEEYDRTHTREKRPSYWGYRHSFAHCMGWVPELLKKTNYACCGGENSGECRISHYVGPNTVLFDGERCPIDPDSHRVEIDGLDPDSVIVCGSHLGYTGDGRPVCPKIWCEGHSSGT